MCDFRNLDENIIKQILAVSIIYNSIKTTNNKVKQMY